MPHNTQPERVIFYERHLASRLMSYGGIAATVIANTTFMLRLSFREKKNLKNFPLSKKKK